MSSAQQMKYRINEVSIGGDLMCNPLASPLFKDPPLVIINERPLALEMSY